MRVVRNLKPARKASPSRNTESGLGDAPEHWSDASKALWDEIAFSAPVGVLTASDRLLVEVTVRNIAQMRATPEMQVAQSGELRRCLSEIGMTPSSRRKLAAATDDDVFEDEF